MGGAAFIIPKQPASGHPISPVQVVPYTKPLLLILSVSVIGFLLLFLFSRTLFDLALLMFRINLVAFGGGFSSVPLMLHEIVEVRNWMDSQTFMNGIVLGQVTPGPIVITATFIGYLLGGPLGGVVATIGTFLPSFLVLVVISPYFDRLRTSPIFNKVIGGVLCSFVGLLLTVTIRFALNVQWDLSHLLLVSSALLALLLKVDILWVVVIGTIISVMVVT
jgi:chromate transporter